MKKRNQEGGKILISIQIEEGLPAPYANWTFNNSNLSSEILVKSQTQRVYLIFSNLKKLLKIIFDSFKIIIIKSDQEKYQNLVV